MRGCTWSQGLASEALARIVNSKLAVALFQWKRIRAAGLQPTTSHNRPSHPLSSACSCSERLPLFAPRAVWAGWASGNADALRLLDLAADGLIPGRAAFTQWAVSPMPRAETPCDSR